VPREPGPFENEVRTDSGTERASLPGAVALEEGPLQGAPPEIEDRPASFLGDIPGEAAPRVAEAAEVEEGTGPFAVILGKFGAGEHEASGVVDRAAQLAEVVEEACGLQREASAVHDGSSAPGLVPKEAGVGDARGPIALDVDGATLGGVA